MRLRRSKPEYASLDSLLDAGDDRIRQEATSRRAWLPLRLVAALLAAALGGVAAAAIALPALAAPALGAREAADFWNESPSELPQVDLPQQSYLLAADGSRIATLFDEDRVPVKLMAVADVAQEAILAIEDARFYEHRGVDYKGIGRAAVRNTQGSRQGASTLTQQYVKNVLLLNAKNPAERELAAGASVARKIREAKYALGVEKTLTKRQILEGYLNIAYFADGAYGIGTAAEHYFSVKAADLTLPQAALLAGLVKDPTRFNPVKNPEVALERRALVLRRMHEVGYITAAERAAATATPLGLKVKRTPNGCVTSPYPFFCTWVREAIRDDKAFGKTDEERKQVLYTGGLTIKTSLEPAKQAVAQQAVDRALRPDNRVAAAAVTVQPGTGKVLSMVTNRQFGTGEGKTQILLPVAPAYQPGSTFKAFTLATALSQGIPTSVTYATPNRYSPPGRNSPPGGFSNAAAGEAGVYNAARATALSVNTWFVQLQHRTGVLAVADTAARLGITSLPRTGDRAITERDASLTLGSYEVSPLEMAGAYAAFAAHGVACRPVGITAVTDRDGTELPTPDPNCRQAISPAVADAVTALLTGVIDGDLSRTGKGASIGRPVAGKTGTTQNYGAAWFAGYTPHLATAVWVGDPRGLRYPLNNVRAYGRGYARVFGGDIPASIWADAMRGQSQGLPPTGFAPAGATAANGVPLTVPDVRGLLGGQARQVLAAAGFTAVVKNAPALPGLPSGRVGSTVPAAGTTAVHGQQIELTVHGREPGLPITDPSPPAAAPPASPAG